MLTPTHKGLLLGSHTSRPRIQLEKCQPAQSEYLESQRWTLGEVQEPQERGAAGLGQDWGSVSGDVPTDPSPKTGCRIEPGQPARKGTAGRSRGSPQVWELARVPCTNGGR